MSLLQSIVAVAAAQGVARATRATMGGKLSHVAAELLGESWQPADEAQEDGQGEGAA
jgi:hypothetical protein